LRGTIWKGGDGEEIFDKKERDRIIERAEVSNVNKYTSLID
jgi:hypothetical protein